MKPKRNFRAAPAFIEPKPATPRPARASSKTAAHIDSSGAALQLTIRKSMTMASQPWFRKAADRAWSVGRLPPVFVRVLQGEEWRRQPWWQWAVTKARKGLGFDR